MVNRCECGSYNVKVTDSRDHNGEIWRTRLCCDCHKRIYSVEIEREQYKKSMEIISAYNSIVGAVKKLEEVNNGSL